MRYGSVCSGVAPQTRDWKSLGLECAWFAEIEPFPSAVLNHHFPEVTNFGDFTRITPEQSGPIDLLVGGTPCQPFSVAGKRAGLDDARGNLTIEFARLAQRLRPRWLVWENVPGVLSIDGGRTFGTFLGMLGQLGYGFAYRVLDAQYFGVAQRRRRVFVVGCLGDWRSAAAVLFERESLSGNPAPSREKGQGITHDVAEGISASGRGTQRTGSSRGQDPVIAMTLNAKGGTGRANPDETMIPVTARCLSTKNERIDWETETFVPIAVRTAQTGSNGWGVNEEGTAYTLDGAQQAVAFAENQRHELRLSDVSPQLSCAGGKPGSGYPATLQGMAVRRLTPRECGLLQGFPDEGKYCLIPTEKWRKITRDEGQYLIGLGLGKWVESRRGCWRTCIVADGPVYKATGNSWAVPVLNWIAKRIVGVSTRE